MSDLMLTFQTRQQRYALLYRQEIELRYIGAREALDATDNRGRPMLSADLCTLLDSADREVWLRRCAFVLPLRRCSVALRCNALNELSHIDATSIKPLPYLIVQRLPHTWFAGFCLFENEPMLLLDLRQIAMHILRQSHALLGETAS
jgi:hypothetical protein